MHKHRNSKIFLYFLMIFLVFATNGCKKSHSNDAPVLSEGAQMMNGIYLTYTFSIENGNPSITIGDVAFDGFGNLTLTPAEFPASNEDNTAAQSARNTDASVSTISRESFSTTYTVTESRLLSFASLTQGESISGQLSTDSNLFFVTDTNKADNNLGFTIGVKRGSGMSNASLSGTYKGVGFFTGTHDEKFAVRAQPFELTFDGLGTSMSNDEGPLEGYTYSVADNGTVTTYVDNKEMPYSKAQLSADGELLLIVFGDNQGSVNSDLFLLTRQHTGMRTADITGNYKFFCFNFEDGDQPSSATSLGTIVSDGTGTITVNTEANTEGYVGSDIETVSVDDTGIITNDEDMQGQLELNGELFIFPDTDDEESEYNMVIGIRKP